MGGAMKFKCVPRRNYVLTGKCLLWNNRGKILNEKNFFYSIMELVLQGFCLEFAFEVKSYKLPESFNFKVVSELSVLLGIVVIFRFC